MNRLFPARVLLTLVFVNIQIAVAATDPFDAPPLAPGTLAPHIVSKTITNKPFDSNTLRGHVTVLDFWATWCIPCKASMPLLEKISKDYAKKGVEVIGLSGDTYTINSVPGVLKKLHVTYPIVADPHKCLQIEDDYNAEPLPSVYIIDTKGVVRWSASGTVDDKLLRKMLDTTLYSK
jgi:thiol-disulfide isomerase/thioredoxin